MKWELEDLSLQYLDPIGYQEIEDALAEQATAHEELHGRHPATRSHQRLEDEGIRLLPSTAA